MARAGARGDTATEMDEVLRTDGWDGLAAGLGALDQRLESHDGAWTEAGPMDDVNADKDTHYLAMRMANMAFAQRGYPIHDEYVDRLGMTFGSGLGLVDYAGAPDEAREAINGWVGRQTVGRIPDLLQEGTVSAATRLVLVNAVYLKAEWAVPFDEGQTRDPATSSHLAAPSASRRWRRSAARRSSSQRATDGGRRSSRTVGANEASPLAMTIVMPDDLERVRVPTSSAGWRAVRGRCRDPTREDSPCGRPTDSGRLRRVPIRRSRLFMPKFGIDTRAGPRCRRSRPWG